MKPLNERNETTTSTTTRSYYLIEPVKHPCCHQSTRAGALRAKLQPEQKIVIHIFSAFLSAMCKPIVTAVTHITEECIILLLCLCYAVTAF
jgi:hypothetical protein